MFSKAIVRGFLAVLVFATAQAQAALYFTGQAGGSPVPFGAIDAAGNKTYIGSGLDLGTDGGGTVRLMHAPNGDLYGFNVTESGGSRSWGRIDPITGAFTIVGDLSNDFFTVNNGSFAREDNGYALAFDSGGTLFAMGYIGNNTHAYGTYDLTTGAFSQAATGPGPFATSLIAAGDGLLYFTDFAGFGAIDAAGNKTYIGSGLDLGTDGGGTVRLMHAPNGDLYGFNVTEGGGSRSWGRIDPITGAFTIVGDLSNDFFTVLDSFAREEMGYALAFDSGGNLFATGYIGNSTYAYGTYDLTTGAFSQAATGGPYAFATSLAADGVPLPEPGTLSLLGILGVCLGGYAWRRRRRVV